MMKLRYLAAAMAALMTTQAPAKDSVDYAYGLCQALRKTLPVSDCKVNGGNASVDVTLPLSELQAIQWCPAIAQETRKQGAHWGKYWELRFFNSQSKRPTAVCDLSPGAQDRR